MFTGIIETTGTVKEVISKGSNKTFWIESALTPEFKIDQSVSHSGVCLTIEEIKGSWHRVTAIGETLQKTNLGQWISGTIINIERCLKMDSRLDGHLVQGHADARGTCIRKKEKNGSWEFEFDFPKKFAELVIEKGSICINGISLTAFNVKKKRLSVAIIPYTYEHTDMQTLQVNDDVNLEFDIIGKYIVREIQLRTRFK
ncbi:MAG: riboflavin synthase [Chitinophagaceae bacterium]|nr:riboflavin synthase [Chitinophagaceae bacterium]